MSYAFDGDFLVAIPRAEAFAVLSSAPRFAPIMPTYISHQEREDGSAVVKVKVNNVQKNGQDSE